MASAFATRSESAVRSILGFFYTEGQVYGYRTQGDGKKLGVHPVLRYTGSHGKCGAECGRSVLFEVMEKPVVRFV
jgi:hypothetical protein